MSRVVFESTTTVYPVKDTGEVEKLTSGLEKVRIEGRLSCERLHGEIPRAGSRIGLFYGTRKEIDLLTD